MKIILSLIFSSFIFAFSIWSIYMSNFAENCISKYVDKNSKSDYLIITNDELNQNYSKYLVSSEFLNVVVDKNNEVENYFRTPARYSSKSIQVYNMSNHASIAFNNEKKFKKIHLRNGENFFKIYKFENGFKISEFEISLINNL